MPGRVAAGRNYRLDHQLRLPASLAVMNTDSVDCRRLPGPLFPRDRTALVPGDFLWEDDFEEDGTRFIYIVLPGDTSPAAIRVQRGAPGGNRVWGWDGN